MTRAMPLAITILLAGQGVIHVPAAPEAQAATGRGPIEEFDVGTSGRPLCVPVFIKEKTFSFLVDTGASKTVFDTELLDFLGRPTGRTMIMTSTGFAGVDLHACPEALVGKVKLSTGGTVICKDLAPIRYASGLDIRGILGMDFLNQFAVEIDVDVGRLRLWGPEESIWDEADAVIPIRFHKDCPLVTATLPDGKAVEFILDTGANNGTLSHSEFDSLVKSNHLGEASVQRVVTIGGEIDATSGYVDELVLGPFRHQHVRLDRDSMSVLGLKYLSRYSLLLNFPKRTAGFRRGKHYSKADSTVSSGMAILQINQQKVVYGIRDDGPADKAGLHVGDIIREIDGTSCSGIDMFELSSMLTDEPGKLVQLTVFRDGHSIDRSLRLQDVRSADE